LKANADNPNTRTKTLEDTLDDENKFVRDAALLGLYERQTD
jgi:hypothetical protein